MVDLTVRPTKRTPMTTPTSNQSGRSLLLISDVPERLQRLESRLRICEVALTRVGSAEEVTDSCRREHDLAIVDVEPQHLAEVLKTLRESEGHASIPVLVERSRLTHDAALAGILPAYRAMPCSFDEMLKLARRRLAASASRRNAETRGIRPIF